MTSRIDISSGFTDPNDDGRHPPKLLSKDRRVIEETINALKIIKNNPEIVARLSIRSSEIKAALMKIANETRKIIA